MPITPLTDDTSRLLAALDRRITILENTNPLEHGSISPTGYFYQADSNGVIRFELGNLPARGISPAQIGWRVNDATGTPIADSQGLQQVVTLIGSSDNTTNSSITGNGTYQNLSMTGPLSFTVSRPVSVLIIGYMAALTSGATGTFTQGRFNRPSGGGTGFSFAGLWDKGNAGFTVATFWRVDKLTLGGTYTITPQANADTGQTFQVSSGHWDVFSLGG